MNRLGCYQMTLVLVLYAVRRVVTLKMIQGFNVFKRLKKYRAA